MLKILVNTILGIILVLVWLQFVDIGEIFITISQAKIMPLLLAFAFMFLSAFARALRFKIFLSEVKKIDLKDLIFLNGVAVILNFFIPIRAGEIAKGVYLNTHYKLELGKSLIWTFLDRFVDFLVVLLVAAFLLLFIPTSLSREVIIIISVTFSLLLLATYLAIFQSSFARKIINFMRYLLIISIIKIYFDKLSHLILDSLVILKRHPKDLGLMILITVVAYGFDGAIWYFTFVSLGSYQEYLKMYLGQLLSALSYLIPAAPGYVGSAEASGLLILSGVFNIEPNFASAMIVLFHIASALFVIIYGLLSIFSLKIDLGSIMKKALRRGN